MKKFIFLFSTILLLWGCEKSEEISNSRKDDVLTENVSDTNLPDIIYASVVEEKASSAVEGEDASDVEGQNPQTRTYVGGENRDEVLWQNGDAISFFAGNIHNARYDYTGEGGTSQVEFDKDGTKPGTAGTLIYRSQAVYPYNENFTVVYEDGIDKINLTYPTTQKYAPNSFGKDANIMVAAGKSNEDDELYFRNACGYLVIKLYGAGTTVKSITLSSVSGLDKIVGNAVVVASNNAAPVITMADDAATAVTLDCSNGGAGVALGADAEHATEFWFCLPPVTFTDGLKITVTDTNDEAYTKQTNKTVNITRNDVQPMAALMFNTNAPAATKLWYTRSDNSTAPISLGDSNFNASIKSHKWDGSKFVVEFNAPLTTIKAEAFRKTNIATITLPEGVTTIEESAFEYSTLLEITIPGSVNNIGIDVFWECSNLHSVTFLPSSTKTPLQIGRMEGAYNYGPFYDTSLNSIDLNRELILVKGDGNIFSQNEWWHGMFATEKAEAGEVGSASVKLGPQVETISDYMFNYLPIESLTIPGTVKTIGNDVFNYCTKLASLTFEPSPTGEPLTIGYEADDGEDENLFQESCPLTTLNLNRELIYTFEEESETIDSNSEGMFGEIPTLTNVTLGEQVKTLQKYMFAGSGITALEIPATVTSIAQNVFDGCKALSSITFAESAIPLQIKGQGDSFGPFYDSPLATIVFNRPIVYTKLNDTVFTPTANELGVFAINPSLKDQITGGTNLTIGQNILTISNHMFCNLPIKALTIPGTVNTIGNDVFNGCTKLATLTFEPSPTLTPTPLTIGYEAEDGEDENLFQEWCPLTTLNLNRELIYTFEEEAETIDSYSEGLFGSLETLTSVTLGDQVKTLQKYMFAGTGITELEIPATVTSIAQNVFDDCQALRSITFAESAIPLQIKGQGDSFGPFYDSPLATIVFKRPIVYTKLNDTVFTPTADELGVFAINPSLKDQITGGTNLTIGQNILTISNHMFCNLPIKALTIPGTVNTIGNDVFNGCDQLATLTFEASPTETALTIGYEAEDGEDENLFQEWCPLTTLNLNRELIYTFEEEAETIDSNSEGMFGSLETLTSVTLGEQVKTLQKYMFAGTGITELVIPVTVTSIAQNVFDDCQALSSITFTESATPLQLNGQGDSYGPFYDSPLAKIVFKRPIDYKKLNGDEFNPTSDAMGLFAISSTAKGMVPAEAETNLTIGQNITNIANYMFCNLPIKTLTIPEAVNTIGNDAFYGCTQLTELTFAGSTEPLTIGYDTEGDDEGLFATSQNLATVNLDRELNYTFPLGDLNDVTEGIFGNHPSLTSVTLGENVKTVLPFMFANTRITELVIPGNVTEIKDFAFYNCTALEELRFEYSATPLTLGFQDWSDELGPFYQSPLKYIKLDRDIKYNDNYEDSCDGWDEGAFSNQYYNSGDWIAKVIIGGNVTTLPKYMFATMRMQQLHIPESVEYIGTRLVEDCKVLNAIVLYDTEKRPEIEDSPFGEGSYSGTAPDDAPGKLQYYVFVPYMRGGGVNGVYWVNAYDADNYWGILYKYIMVESAEYFDFRIERNHESRYYDKEKGGEAGIIPGYEWYYQRYYLKQEVTPPTE